MLLTNSSGLGFQKDSGTIRKTLSEGARGMYLNGLVLNCSGRRWGTPTCQCRAERHCAELLTFSHFLPWYRHPAKGSRGEGRGRERGRERWGERARKYRDRNQDKICSGQWVLNQGEVIREYSSPPLQGLGCLENDFHFREKLSEKLKTSPKKIGYNFFHTKTSLRDTNSHGRNILWNKIFILVSLMRISRQKIVSRGNHARERYFKIKVYLTHKPTH